MEGNNAKVIENSEGKNIFMSKLLMPSSKFTLEK
jgi:hypothetical protein